MARRIHRSAIMGAIAFVAMTVGGCGAAATAAPGSTATAQAPESAAAQSSAASAPASAPASATSASAPASASAPPSAAGDPSPAAQKRYKCGSLISDAEMSSASGYKEAKLFGEDQTGNLAGQTYCQFFTGNAGISIAVSVFTAGPGWDQAFLPLWKLGQINPAAVHLSGIGDGAIYGATSHAGLAVVSGKGISVIFSDLASGKLKGVDLQAQVTKILTVLAGRV